MEEDRNLPVVEEEPQQGVEDRNLPRGMGAVEKAPEPKTQEKAKQQGTSQKPMEPLKEQRKIPLRYIYIIVVLLAIGIVAYFAASGNLISVFSTSTTSTTSTSTSTSTTSTTTINPFNQGTLAYYLAANRGRLGLAALANYLNANVSSIGLINASYSSVLKIETGQNFSTTTNTSYAIQKYFRNISFATKSANYLETDVKNANGSYICIAQKGEGYLCAASAQTNVLNASFNPLSGIFRPGNSSILMRGLLSNLSVETDSRSYNGGVCTLFNSAINASSHIDTVEVGNITNVFVGNLTECISNSHYVPLFSRLSGVLITIAKLSTGYASQGITNVSLSTNMTYLNSNASVAAASALPGKIIG